MDTKPLRLSNSRVDLYKQCGAKYAFRYVDNLKGDYTASPLLFGSAIDSALNGILEAIRDGKPWTQEAANSEFMKKMNLWNSDLNRLDFFKGDVPKEYQDQIEPNDPAFQELVWDEMVRRGLDVIDRYIKQILPLFKRIVSVQDEKIITNEAGDEYILIVDFIAELHDGRIVLLDNKTAGTFDQYPKKAVVKSQQLSLYLEQFPEIKYAGYIVMIKDPERTKGVGFRVIIDEIPEETTAASYELLDQTLKGIKAGVFEKNPGNCFAYGKPCEYTKICKKGSDPSLVKNR